MARPRSRLEATNVKPTKATRVAAALRGEVICPGCGERGEDRYDDVFTCGNGDCDIYKYDARGVIKKGWRSGVTTWVRRKV